MILKLSTDFSANLKVLMSYFATIGWTISEQLELAMALSIGSIELISFDDLDLSTVILSEATFAKFEEAVTSAGLIFAVEFRNILASNTNFDFSTLSEESMVSLQTFFEKEIFEADSMSFDLYNLAFEALESEISEDVRSATRIAIFLSFTELSGFDAEAFSTGKIVIPGSTIN